MTIDIGPGITVGFKLSEHMSNERIENPLANMVTGGEEQRTTLDTRWHHRFGHETVKE